MLTLPIESRMASRALLGFVRYNRLLLCCFTVLGFLYSIRGLYLSVEAKHSQAKGK